MVIGSNKSKLKILHRNFCLSNNEFFRKLPVQRTVQDYLHAQFSHSLLGEEAISFIIILSVSTTQGKPPLTLWSLATFSHAPARIPTWAVVRDKKHSVAMP